MAQGITRLAGLALSIAIIAGCQSTGTRTSVTEELISAPGSYTHAPSGLVFPPSAGPFRRGQITQYGTDGELGTGVGYNLYQPPQAVATTIFVYHSSELISIGSPPEVISDARTTLCDNDYQARKREILRVHEGARLVSEGPLTLSNSGAAIPGRTATFHYSEPFAGRRQVLESRLDVICYIDGKWSVTYRSTYPASFDATEALATFMDHTPWP